TWSTCAKIRHCHGDVTASSHRESRVGGKTRFTSFACKIGMGESRLIMEELLAFFNQRIAMEENAMNIELEFIEVVKNFEAVRKQWLHAETELKKYKELLVKSDVAKAGLEVQLKHARNQLDVEMRRRYKMEADYQYLQRQMQLMCDILVQDSKASACLNEEQKSLLATFDHKGANKTAHRSSKRLSAIDESSFFSHSDISYDRTDEDMDLDTTLLKPLRSRARERRRSSMGVTISAALGKPGQSGNVSPETLGRETVEKVVETIVQELVMTPETGGPVHTVAEITQERPEEPAQESALPDSGRDQTSVGFPSDPNAAHVQMETCPKHDFLSKTVRDSSGFLFKKFNLRHHHNLPLAFLRQVIRPEMCLPCGKRIRFGKIALKCRGCRIVSHPECKQKWSEACAPTASTRAAHMVSLEGFAPASHPSIPALVVKCVKEIERRGLQERGLYRVPGGERQVKELRDRFMGGKTQLQLSDVSDIHVVCGVLKDFLRKLKEPLVTFKLHRNFMAASEMSNEQERSAAIFRAIAQLPKPNRDTLAFLMLHLHKVMRSPPCQMDQNNLSRVFGPTLVGHALSEPSPSTIMRDTNIQPKVICHFLSVPEDYWKRVLGAQGASSHKRSNQGEGLAPFFDPLTSPELNHHDVPARTSMRSRARNLGK
ncbi:LOW QUALITY PROTEIN: rac GTPase-activating protein 1, partial [Hippocampus zosterae]|uniref:LOW QUALITY PROTEIN: rac GTPase-activating protein 1 n=1 Tax=Hippocampus zosterae TaxID=109293 RepID=UPI00223CBAF2